MAQESRSRSVEVLGVLMKAPGCTTGSRPTCAASPLATAAVGQRSCGSAAAAAPCNTPVCPRA